MNIPSICLRNVRLRLNTNCSHIRYCKQTSKEYRPSRPIRKYILSKYLKYVQNYENALEKRFPAAMRIYRVFKIGITDFYQDMKAFLVIAKKVNASANGGIQSLTRLELELYYKVPSDMCKIAPVLLVSALPIVNYAVFPVAYWFPKQLLTSQFWSLQQRTQFAVIDLRRRLWHYKPLFRCLQARLDSLQAHPLHIPWNMCIAMLGSGLHPSLQNIIACIPLFSEYPYSFKNLKRRHLKELLKIHCMHQGWFKRKRLTERAKMIYLLDRAIDKEGGVRSLNHEELRTACFLRGLNPTNLNTEDAYAWLSQWLELSKQIPSSCPSLLLHAPILLAYNHPSNWVLIH